VALSAGYSQPSRFWKELFCWPCVTFITREDNLTSNLLLPSSPEQIHIHRFHVNWHTLNYFIGEGRGEEGGADPVKSVEIVEVGTWEGIGVISVKSTDSKD